MGRRAKEYAYTVEGYGEFPLDMLRRDCSRPATEDDRREIERAYAYAPRARHRVKLLTRDRTAPLVARWESFGFRVVEADAWLFGGVSQPSRGRPREHPEGTSPSDRARRSDDALAARGGRRTSLRLPQDALDALEEVKAATGELTDSGVIRRLVLEEAERLPARSAGR